MFIIFLTIFCAVLWLYLNGTRNYTYWLKRGVKHDVPLPFFGNNLRQYCLRVSLSDLMVEMYNKYPNERYVGFYIAEDPYLILKDPEIIREVLEVDFSHFYSRFVHPQRLNNLEPLLNNIFFNHGDLWKLLRQRMTPAFTTSKLKALFPLIRERADVLQKVASLYAKEGRVVDARELLARFTTDFIGASTFGLDVDSLNDEQSEFRKLGKRMFTVSKRALFIGMLKNKWPQLFKNWNLISPNLERDTLSLVQNILHDRNYEPSGRNDMVDILLEMKQKGKMVGNSIENFNEDGTAQVTEIDFDDKLISSHIFLFFGAGFETSATAASHTLHQLAYHPEIQSKCQEEIDRVMSKHNNILSYESIKEMKYLEMTLYESLRMYPPLGYLIRTCAKKYTLPGTGITLDKGVAIVVSLHAIHNDEKYFENPSQFRPERFGPNEVGDIKKHVYLPFGTGPRLCIGERLAYIQTLSALASVLQACTVAPAQDTKRWPEPDPTTVIVQSPKGGLPLLFKPRVK